MTRRFPFDRDTRIMLYVAIVVALVGMVFLALDKPSGAWNFFAGAIGVTIGALILAWIKRRRSLKGPGKQDSHRWH